MSTFDEVLAREGELIEVSAHQPFLLDDPTRAWYVVTGGILLFTVALEKGRPKGTRAHVVDLEPGHCLLGFDLHRQQSGAGFLAVARAGTTLRRLPIARLRELAADAVHASAIAHLIDTWVGRLSTSLARSLTVKRSVTPVLEPDKDVECSPRARATSARGVVWIEILSGGVRFDDLAVPRFTTRHTLFPVAPDAWIQPLDEEFGPLAVRPAATVHVIGSPALWHGLQVFQDVLCECELTHRKQAEDDESARLEEKERDRKRAHDLAYEAIGSVLSPESDTPQEFLATTTAEPVLRVCQLVGRACGMAVKAHPEVSANDELTFEERVAAIASASGFRTRLVALRDDWWQRDHGPLIGQRSESKGPVALLPTGARRYELVDAATGARTPIDTVVAATLTPFAYAPYRPFPTGRLRVRDLVRFGAWGIKPDVRTLIGTAIGIGLFGTITPYLTGRIFDAAVPQADRWMLVGFGLALALSAAATSMFKLVQGITAVRVQARMEYAIQSAMWDRVLSLPAAFFRSFSAGDLADRIGGVDVIQTLISGAGVAAILGSLSGLFFIVQMMAYSFNLALLAVVLTMLFVGANMVANYLQLRYQREEMHVRGSVAGLVLNLITGVSKVRTCGAEPHAFRVWAEKFSKQRRLAFRAGLIQAGATVFSTTFPIVSSIAIFLLMLSEQQAASERGGAGLTTGEFIAFTTAYGLFLAAMQALGDASLSLLRMVPVYERFQPILTTPPEVDSTRAFPGKLTGEIELSHVSFRYHEDGPWILRDVSLKIAAGEFMAFVGASGCGKSTLMRLMLGFERPTSGAIYFDGQDLNSLDLRMLRQQMGVVLQVSRVLPTEIYRNILGASSSRTIEDAWEAAEMAGLADDVRNMPMGMHTYVAEGGGTLSGGQRQRLLIARAIVHRPKIMFLDEATSALDNRAQAIITESLDRLDATRIVIAHRLSTIVNADRICFLDGGKIAEQGTHRELMDRQGAFARLATRQMA